MKWKHFMKNTVDKTVRLHPAARFFDSSDIELPAMDDDWRILDFPEEKSVRLVNLRTSSQVVLAKDAIYGYADDAHRTNSAKDGTAYGFLTLKLEVLVRNGAVSTRLNARPGEAVGSRIEPQWTNPIGVSLDEVVPPGALSATIQYRLWSSDSRIELMLRISRADGSALQEFSGASGVIKWPLLIDRTIYLSFSHPLVRFDISVIGFKVNNGG